MIVIVEMIIGPIILLCVISLCLCKIMKSWHPLKSLVISLETFVAIIFIGWLALMSRLFVILLLTLYPLIVIPPSILITHAIVTNDVSSKTEKYTYRKTIFLFVIILIIVCVVKGIAFKLTGWHF
jgi:hypothetical protein